jgi:hypothetical protein
VKPQQAKHGLLVVSELGTEVTPSSIVYIYIYRFVIVAVPAAV